MAKSFNNILVAQVVLELENNKELTTEQRLGLLKILAKVRSDNVRTRLQFGKSRAENKRGKTLTAKGVDLPSDPAALEFLEKLDKSKELPDDKTDRDAA